MLFTAEDLVARFRADFPAEAQLCELRLLVEAQDREIDRLTALVNAPAPSYPSSTPLLPADHLLADARHDSATRAQEDLL